MPTIKTRDGTEIFYKDWGSGTPVMLKSETNPGGLPLAVFEEIRARTLADRSQFFQELPVPF